MDGEVVVRVESLGKSFGDTKALRDLAFEVRRGSVFGLIGPNGSGKTTAIRIILGLLRPDAGRSSVFDEDSLTLPWQTRQRIGYLSEEPFPYGELPIDDLLRFVSSFFETWDWRRTSDLLARLKVPRDKPLELMSKGQRRKAEFLLAMAQGPDLLILDDPAVGLDASTRREFLWSALDVARQENKTVLFTSHVLHDVERVVDTVGFLRGGRMRLVASLEDLKRRTKRVVVEGGRPPPIPGEVERTESEDVVSIVTTAFEPGIVSELRPVSDRVTVEDLNLEEIYLVLAAAAEEALS